MFKALMLVLVLVLAGVAQAQTSVSAAAPGQGTPATTSVLWLAKTVVQSVVCPVSLEQGTVGTCTVTLNQSAPADKLIHPASGDTTKFTVGPDFTILKGTNSGTFAITAL